MKSFDGNFARSIELVNPSPLLFVHFAQRGGEGFSKEVFITNRNSWHGQDIFFFQNGAKFIAIAKL